MKDFNYTIKDSAGIHARPAGLLVKLAQTFNSDVSLHCKGKAANVKKLFALMGMGVKCGEEIVITAEGEDEDAAIQGIKSFITENM